jgi:hypothetical protein
MKNTILKTYKRQRESDLVTTGHRIVEKMENNTNFPNPPASLANLKKILPEYQAALIAAKGRDRELISIKNDKKAQLLAFFAELAQYVTVTCNGDRSLLLGSGFDVYGERVTVAAPFIEKLEVELGPPGEATTRIKRLAGARAFQHQYTTELPSSNTVWTSELSTHPSHTFKGLDSAVKYWFRVAAVTNSGQMVYSPTVQRIIQ